MREYTKDEMKVWVKTAAPKRIGNALVEMFNRQTTDEQSSGVTCHDNGIGFNGVDAPILTSIAKWYMDKGFISPKQTALVRKKLAKYAGHEIPDLAYSALMDLVFVRVPNLKKWRGPTRVRRVNGNTSYSVRIYQHHGSGAARTSGGKLNTLIAKMREFEADLYFVAHAHEKQDQELPIIGANHDCTHLTEHRRVGVRTGSYLRTYAQGQTGYGEIAGFPPSCLGARAVEISPNECRITKIVL